jgi:glycerol-3-phosphate dehydrogenase (NAD(P)+)
VLTCTGPASRNFSLGAALGRGETLASLLPAGGPAVEAVTTTPALLARAGELDLPICRAVGDLLSGQVDIGGLVARLLARPMRDE